jgi:hypothetical protein
MLVCGACAAQSKDGSGTSGGDYAAVYLEPHAGQTQFKIGDPVVMDLVFAGKAAQYVVKTESGPYLPPVDEVDVAPAGGWVRTRAIARGLPLNLNALVPLKGDAIRVPMLVNRTVTFTTPGHYAVTVTTDRLRLKDTLLKETALDKCDVCRKTTAVSIDVVARDAGEEAALIKELTRAIEEGAKGDALETAPTDEEKAQRDHEIAEIQIGASLSDEDMARDTALLWKWKESVRAQTVATEQRREARREAALRLACLEGDEAVRAKVRLIAAGGEADTVTRMMVEGLASSQNKQLQLDLLEQAWRDPATVPTFELERALREARELQQGKMVTDEAWDWAALKADRGEIDALVATLPMRSEANRAETVAFLKRLGVAAELGGMKASR